MSEPLGAPRDTAVDIGRGLAIVMIVLGHVLRGAAGAGLVSGGEPLFDELDSALYLVHLPVFAVLAGVFVGPSVRRAGAGPFLRRRALLFGWLYLVWTVLQGAVKLLTGSLVNTPTSPAGVLRQLVAPDSQLWWLGLVLLLSAAAALVRPWEGGARAWASGLVALVVSGLAWGHQGTYLFLQGLGLTAFFWAGAVAGTDGWRRATRGAPVVLVGGGLVAAVLLVLTDPMPPTSWTRGPDPTALALGVVASVAGTGAVLAVGVLLARGPAALSAVLTLLGRRSLEIYLAHIVATAGARVVLLQLGVGDLTVHLLAGTVAGLVFPLALWWGAERLHAPWLFRLPSRRPAPSTREVAAP
ncbi:acyltransferase family protein [Phycicoccus duodecadis]|uniref:Fucose 4-O-acetylase-like acetyltransferase n=1 Tax=Phycicoccus duodecadis TaxID=173053 RepID=A0A2N3YMB5_9MICO|nr:acyltransferase [Phycicoccus duodecadis]PKW28001.1 fucose 4-O-acetylase-like acetyltransferase [Phycicoccus duodecadis]